MTTKKHQTFTVGDSPAIEKIFNAVFEERVRQDERWGQQNHVDGTADNDRNRQLAMDHQRLCQTAFAEKRGTWAHVMLEEVYEALAEGDPAKLRVELVQTAAVIVAWVEAIDRRTA